MQYHKKEITDSKHLRMSHSITKKHSKSEEFIKEVTIQIFKEQKEMFRRRADLGFHDKPRGHVFHITESKTGDEKIDSCLREWDSELEGNVGYYRELFSFNWDGFDGYYQNSPYVDATRKLGDLDTRTPARTYAQELSEGLNGSVLYYAGHGHRSDELKDDYEHTFLAVHVYRDGEEAASYSFGA